MRNRVGITPTELVVRRPDRAASAISWMLMYPQGRYALAQAARVLADPDFQALLDNANAEHAFSVRHDLASPYGGPTDELRDFGFCGGDPSWLGTADA